MLVAECFDQDAYAFTVAIYTNAACSQASGYAPSLDP